VPLAALGAALLVTSAPFVPSTTMPGAMIMCRDVVGEVNPADVLGSGILVGRIDVAGGKSRRTSEEND
jgi:hypothetical protein